MILSRSQPNFAAQIKNEVWKPRRDMYCLESVTTWSQRSALNSRSQFWVQLFTFLKSMICSMSEKCAKRKYFISNLYPMQKYVSIKALLSRIVVFLVWPRCLRWGTRKWKYYKLKIGSSLRYLRLKLRFHYHSYTVFLLEDQYEPVAWCLRQIEVSRATLVRIPQGTGISAILHGTEPVSGLTSSLNIEVLSFIFSFSIFARLCKWWSHAYWV